MIELHCSRCLALKLSVCFAPCMVRKWKESGGSASIQCISCVRAKREARKSKAIGRSPELVYGRQCVKPSL